MRLLSCGMHRGASIEQLRDISNFQNSFIYLWLVYVKPSSLSIQHFVGVIMLCHSLILFYHSSVNFFVSSFCPELLT